MTTLIERLQHDVEDWFYNYFTLDNFDDTDELIDGLYKAVQLQRDSSILCDCFDSMICDYHWDSCVIDKNYEAIEDTVYDNAVWKLGRYGIKV